MHAYPRQERQSGDRPHGFDKIPIEQGEVPVGEDSVLDVVADLFPADEADVPDASDGSYVYHDQYLNVNECLSGDHVHYGPPSTHGNRPIAEILVAIRYGPVESDAREQWDLRPSIAIQLLQLIGSATAPVAAVQTPSAPTAAVPAPSIAISAHASIATPAAA